MPVPIICLDDEWCHFMEGYRPPDEQAPVSVLRDCTVGTDADVEGRHTLVGLLEQVAERTSLSGRSRSRATTQDAAQAVRTPQATPRDRVSDRGRLDDAQADRKSIGPMTWCSNLPSCCAHTASEHLDACVLATWDIRSKIRG